MVKCCSTSGCCVGFGVKCGCIQTVVVDRGPIFEQSGIFHERES